MIPWFKKKAKVEEQNERNFDLNLWVEEGWLYYGKRGELPGVGQKYTGLIHPKRKYHEVYYLDDISDSVDRYHTMETPESVARMVMHHLVNITKENVSSSHITLYSNPKLNSNEVGGQLGSVCNDAIHQYRPLTWDESQKILLAIRNHMEELVVQYEGKN